MWPPPYNLQHSIWSHDPNRSDSLSAESGISLGTTGVTKKTKNKKTNSKTQYQNFLSSLNGSRMGSAIAP